MGYKYTENREYWPSNDKLYKATKQTPWSEKIAKRRLTFFGHVCRLPDTTPVKIALREALRPSKKTRGRPKNTYPHPHFAQFKRSKNGNLGASSTGE